MSMYVKLISFMKRNVAIWFFLCDVYLLLLPSSLSVTYNVDEQNIYNIKLNKV